MLSAVECRGCRAVEAVEAVERCRGCRGCRASTVGPGHRVDAVEVGSTASTALYSRISLQLSLQHAAMRDLSDRAVVPFVGFR